jgi:hypothetical protein
MTEEHEAKQPYKCAICAKFDAQEKLQEHYKEVYSNFDVWPSVIGGLVRTVGIAYSVRPVLRRVSRTERKPQEV